MNILSDQEFTARIFEIAGEQVEHFEPFIFNNTDGDCIEFFVSDDNYYGERIDDYLTVYHSQETGEVAGFVIKNVKRILNRLFQQKSAMEFVIDDGKVQLRSLFVLMFANENHNDQDGKRDLIVREYRKVVEVAETYRLNELELSLIPDWSANFQNSLVSSPRLPSTSKTAI